MLDNLQGVGKVDVIVTSETAKVGNNSLSSGNIVVVKSPTLPFGQGEGDLQLDIFKVARSKGGGTLHSIQVVVESRALGQEHGTRYTLEVDVGLELVFKGRLDEGQGFFLFQKTLNRRFVAVFEYMLGWEPGQWFLGVEGGSHGGFCRWYR
jgi:hypothetical protein